MKFISRNGLSVLVFASFGLLLGCGGGGGGSDPTPAVRITINGPQVVNSFDDCNGSSWGECVRLSAVFETAGGARLSSARWDFADYRPGFSQECVSRYTDGDELVVPAYCSSSGYWCDYDIILDWFDGENSRQTSKRARVQYGALQCASGMGVVFNGERLSGALVFSDTNNNGFHDDGELSAYSNFYGEFDLNNQGTPVDTLVAIGGKGIESGIDYTGSLMILDPALSQSTWITQFSTLDAFHRTNPEVDLLLEHRSVARNSNPEKDTNRMELELEIGRLVEERKQEMVGDTKDLYRSVLQDLL
tara:strand:- start:611 stop:1522 length:912 start_codon:yes stop_codon:yes gene_type:complete